MDDLAGEIFAAKAGLIVLPHIPAKLERAFVFVGWDVQSEGQQANHETFVGLRGMAGDGEFVVGIKLSVEVGDFEAGLVDGGFDGHACGLKLEVRCGQGKQAPRPSRKEAADQRVREMDHLEFGRRRGFRNAGMGL
jgi:hypothetical protein